MPDLSRAISAHQRSLSRLFSKVCIFVLSVFILISAVYTYTRVLTPAPVTAATSSNINYQARLKNANGSLVADGLYNIEFKIHSALTGGSVLWTEAHIDTDGAGAAADNRVRVVNGYLSVNLNSINNNWGSITNWDTDMWLTMNVGGTTHTGSPTYDGEMSPRIKLTGVPYAMAASRADTLDGIDSTAFAQLGSNQTFTGTNAISVTNTAAFVIQKASSGDSLFTADTTNNQLKVGNDTGSAAADYTLLVLDKVGATANLPVGTNGGMIYDDQVDKFKIYENGAWKILCNTTDLGCGAGGGASTLQDAYNLDTDGSDAIIALSSTDGSLVVRNPSSGGIASGASLKVEQLSTGAVEGLRIESAGSGDLFVIRDTTATATNVLTVSNGGQMTLRPATGTNEALLIQDYDGSSLYSVNVNAKNVWQKMTLDIEGATSTDKLLRTYVTSDPEYRFSVRTDGMLQWGAGNVVQDTNLYRSAANTLKTDDNFNIQTATDSASAFQVQDAAGASILNVNSTTGNILLSNTKITYMGGGDATGGTNTGANGGDFNSVSMVDNLAYYVKNGSGATCTANTTQGQGCEFQIWDYSSPAAPTLIGAADGGGLSGGAGGSGNANARGLAVSGKYAYMVKAGSASTCSQTPGSADGCELVIYDISNPRNPTYVGGADVSGTANSGSGNSDYNNITINGRYAYIVKAADATACSSAIGCELQIWDIANPYRPVYIGGADQNGTTNAGTANLSGFQAVTVSGNYIYVGKSGTVDSTACSSTAGSAGAQRCEVMVFDGSNPASPTYVYGIDGSGTVGSGTNDSVTNQMQVAGNYLYVARSGNGSACSGAIGCELQIYRINNTGSTVPVYVGGADASGTANNGTSSVNALYITVAGRYAYLGFTGNSSAACSQTAGSAIGCEFKIFDISNPATPVYTSGIDANGTATGSTAHNFEAVAVSGHYAAVAQASESATNCSAVTGCETKFFDITGFEAPSITAGSIKTGNLQVQEANVSGSLSLAGTLTVGQSVQIAGQIAVSGPALFQNSVNSTTALQVQNAAGTSLLTVDTTNSDIKTAANIYAVGSADSATATTSGTGTTTTTLTFSATTSFANNDVIYIDNAGQDYYTRIVSGGNAASVTVSPAVTFETGRTVTRYFVQNIGSATNAPPASNNERYFQGYFLGGVVTGAGSTTLSDGLLQSSGTLALTASGSSNTGVTVKNDNNSTAAFQVQNTAGVAILSVDTTNSKLEVNGDVYSKGLSWTTQTTPANNNWTNVTYGNGIFVAVSDSGVSNSIMTSPDGVNWTARTAPVTNFWYDVTYGNGLFVAVAYTGTGNRVMTSTDGVTWTARTSAADNTWVNVAYGNGLFVAVSIDGASQVMTSPDGINWTARTVPTANQWAGLTYGNGQFVATAQTGTGNRAMTSPDGITWTTQTTPANNNWVSVTYGNGLYVATATTGTGNRVMTSPNGVNWTVRSYPADNNWYSVTYGNGLFVAVATTGTGNRVMTSPDGINWTSRTNPTDNDWRSVAYGNGQFVAVSITGTGNRAMTSGRPELSVLSTNNTYQGGMTVTGTTALRGTLTGATRGSDLVSSSNFNTTWTPAGASPWLTTPLTSQATHIVGNTTSIQPLTPLTITAGSVYAVKFDLSATTAGSVQPQIGGTTGSYVGTNSDGIVQYITATTTGNLMFNPTSDFDGTIDSVDVFLVTSASSVLEVRNETNGIDLEVRSGGGGNDTTFLGLQAGAFSRANNYGNTGIGAYALQYNVAGSDNTAIGTYSQKQNYSGYSNTSVGSYTLQKNTSGYENTALGTYGLYSNISGFANTALGYTALYDNVSGSYNTALGHRSLSNNDTGNSNIAIGYDTLGNQTGGSNNTVVGTSAGRNNNGSNNTVLGYQAGYNSTGTASGNVLLGYQAGYSETGSNKLYIENSNSANPLIGGDFSTDSLTFNGTVLGKNTTNSTTAFQIQNAAGTSLLNTDAVQGITSITGNGAVVRQNQTITDDFNRASLGSNWTARSGTFDINTNRARFTVDGGAVADVLRYTAYVPNTPDYTVQADVNFNSMSTASNNYACVIGRQANFGAADSDGYFVCINNIDGTLRLIKKVSGSYTILGTNYTIPGYSNATTYTIKLSMHGTRIEAYLNGTLRTSVTDSAFSATGVAAISAADGAGLTGQTFDNFVIAEDAVLRVQNSAGTADVFRVDTTGAVVAKSSVDTTTAFQIQNAAGTSFFTVDTTNSGVTLGNTSGTTTLNLQGGSGGINVSTPDEVEKMFSVGYSGRAILTVNGFDKDYVINNGTEAVGNYVQNPGFEAGGTDSYSGWALDAANSSTIITSAANAHSGNKVLRTTGIGVSSAPAYTSKFFAVQPGETYFLEAWVKTDGTAPGQGGYYLEFRDKDHATPTFANSTWTNPGGTWTKRTISATVPAGKYYMQVFMTTRADALSGNWYFDDVYLTRSSEQAPQLFKNSVDTTNAFQIKDDADASVLNVDTSLDRLTVGTTGNTTGTLLVLDQVPFANLPAASSTINGAMVYDSTNNKFKCVINGAWADCGGAGSASTLATAYSGGASQTDSTITLDSTRSGMIIQDNATPIVGNLLNIQENTANGAATLLGVSTTGVTIQDTSGNNAFLFDSTNSVLRVYENVNGATNYAQIYYAGGEAVFAASTGTTRIGSGSGNITMNLTNPTDVLTFTHTGSATGAFTANDFTITRNISAGTNPITIASAVLKVEDLSTFTGGGSNSGTVLNLVQGATSTGALLTAYHGGTNVFNLDSTGGVSMSGQLFASGGAEITGFTLLDGNVDIGGNLFVGGATGVSIDSNLTVLGYAQIDGNLDAFGTLTVNDISGGVDDIIINAATAKKIDINSNAASTWQTTSGALTITGAAASTWSTSAGALTLQGAAGLNLRSTTGNIVVGTSNTTGTLLVLDEDTDATIGSEPTGVEGGMYYSTTLDKFRCFENSTWKNCIQTNYVQLTANRTSAVTTYANITDLTWNLAANTNYDIECSFKYSANATTTGIGISWTGPASPTYTQGSMTSQLVSTAAANMMSTTINGNDTGGATIESAATTNNWAEFRGTWRNGATAGALQMRFRSEVAVASGIVIQSGSWCKYTIIQ